MNGAFSGSEQCDGFILLYIAKFLNHLLIRIFLFCAADGIQNGMAKMQKAFEIYPYSSMALNHLANHFFFTGQHFLVEQLTETALAASNHGLMKSYSYYNLARSYHSKVWQTCLYIFYLHIKHAWMCSHTWYALVYDECAVNLVFLLFLNYQ